MDFGINMQQSRRLFSPEEELLIVTEVEKFKCILLQGGKSNIMIQQKREYWQKLADMINEESGHEVIRTWNEVRKKFHNCVDKAKTELQAHFLIEKRRTASTENTIAPPPISPLTNKILEIYGTNHLMFQRLFSKVLENQIDLPNQPQIDSSALRNALTHSPAIPPPTSIILAAKRRQDSIQSDEEQATSAKRTPEIKQEPYDTFFEQEETSAPNRSFFDAIAQQQSVPKTHENGLTDECYRRLLPVETFECDDSELDTLEEEHNATETNNENGPSATITTSTPMLRNTANSNEAEHGLSRKRHEVATSWGEPTSNPEAEQQTQACPSPLTDYEARQQNDLNEIGLYCKKLKALYYFTKLKKLGVTDLPQPPQCLEKTLLPHF